MKRFLVLAIALIALVSCIRPTETPVVPPTDTPTFVSPLTPTPFESPLTPTPNMSPLTPTPGITPLAPVLASTPEKQPVEEENKMDFGSIGSVEVMFMVVGIAQLVFYFTTRPAVKDENGNVTVPEKQMVAGRGKVAVVLAIAIPLLFLREVLYAGALDPAAVSIIEGIARVVGDGLAIPGSVGLLKDIFERG
jgi:hypothetical protein